MLRVTQVDPGGVGTDTVKLTLDVAVPPAVMTCNGPLLAPLGTMATSSVELELNTVALTPLKRTVLALATLAKFEPETMTCVPMLPVTGENDVIVGWLGVFPGSLGWLGGVGCVGVPPPPPPPQPKSTRLARTRKPADRKLVNTPQSRPMRSAFRSTPYWRSADSMQPERSARVTPVSVS
jgi:hypothetical protein